MWLPPAIDVRAVENSVASLAVDVRAVDMRALKDSVVPTYDRCKGDRYKSA